jgi:hypothetical protein
MVVPLDSLVDMLKSKGGAKGIKISATTAIVATTATTIIIKATITFVFLFIDVGGGGGGGCNMLIYLQILNGSFIFNY